MQLEVAGVGAFDLWEWSAGAGEPSLVYLHGFEQHPGDAAFLRRLAERRRVVAPEQPGYGSSQGFEHLTDLTDLVLAYRTYLEALGPGPFDLVGHSLGGMLAAELAALCPQLVRRLVLVDPFGLWLDDVACADPFGPPAVVQAASWAGAAPDILPSNLAAESTADDPHAALLFRARNLATATKYLWPLPDRGLRRRLPYVKAPTLVVNGEADGLVPLAYAAEFVRLIPRATLAAIAGAGHYPMIERPDEFAATVEAFLAEDGR